MNTAIAVRAAHITDTAELLKQLDELRLTCQRLNHELSIYKGHHLTPARGCRIATVTVGNLSIPVEYDYVEAEEACLNLDSPRFGPGCDEEITPLRAFLDAKWNDIQDLQEAFSDENLIQAISEEITTEREDQREAFYDDQARWA